MISARLNRADIQGNILRGYTFERAEHLLVRLKDVANGREWLKRLLPSVTTAEDWPAGKKPPVARNVAITAQGLRALGVPESYVKACDPAFLDGMAKRADRLGDTGDSAPENWDPGLTSGDGHILVSVYAIDKDELDGALASIRQCLDEAGIKVIHEQEAHRLPGAIEHFGFSDGLGQPRLAGVSEGRRGRAHDRYVDWFRRPRAFPPGEFLLGHRDLDHVVTPGPSGPLGVNSTYLVYRKLKQDVPGFLDFVKKQAERCGMDEELLKAKIVGRWSDGTPLILSPRRPDPHISGDPTLINDFRYGADLDGLRCPLGAHIRRMNPRDALGYGTSLSARHRMIRRGMPYGEQLSQSAPSASDDRGLLFLCFVADIERQFEFVQTQWCNDGNAFGLGHDPDVLVGARYGEAAKMVVHDPRRPKILWPLPSLVTTRGGEYLLVPSLEGLRALAAGRVGATG